MKCVRSESFYSRGGGRNFHDRINFPFKLRRTKLRKKFVKTRNICEANERKTWRKLSEFFGVEKSLKVLVRKREKVDGVVEEFTDKDGSERKIREKYSFERASFSSLPTVATAAVLVILQRNFYGFHPHENRDKKDVGGGGRRTKKKGTKRRSKWQRRFSELLAKFFLNNFTNFPEKNRRQINNPF